MRRYVLRRLVAALPLLLAITVVVFFLMRLAPGGPLAGIAPGGVDRDRLAHEIGLDRPLIVQYLVWLGRLLHGDFGRSLVTQEPVRAMIASRLPATLELVGTALVLSLAVGLGLGILSALRRDRPLDHVLAAVSLVGLSVPVFWLGVLAILVFSASLGWLPSGGRGTIGAPFSWTDHLRHLVLPACVLAAVYVPQWTRHVRASLLEALSEEHVRAARARGISETRIVLRHALRPALVPVVTLGGVQLPALFTGAVITETIFAWPGMGRLFYDGIERFDYPRLMGILVISSLFIVLGNLAADLVNARLDPRVQLGREP